MAQSQTVLKHPIVQDHEWSWFENWISCTVCEMWADIMKTQLQKVQNVKGLKGLLWFLCTLNDSQAFCKYSVGPQVDQVEDEIFTLMMSKLMICGYLFDLCRPAYNLYQYSHEDWVKEALADKPDIYQKNDAIDNIYAYSNPMTNPAIFRILFLSDIDLDWNYKANASTECYDAACCHEDVEELADELKAPLYGTTKCNLPIEGFKKMIDTINQLNTTNYLSFASIIVTFGVNVVQLTAIFLTY